MSKRKVKALLIILICLIFTITCTACSLKVVEVGSDNIAETSDTDPGSGTGGPEMSGDKAAVPDTETGASYTESEANQGDSFPDTGLTLETLENEGFKAFTDQSYDVEIENFGQVTLVTGSVEVDGLSKLKIYLIDGNGKVLYEFSDFYGNWSMLCYVTDVAFNDLNRDGLKDFIVIAYYMTGVGPTGAEEFPVAGVYFQHGREFVSIPWLDEEIFMQEDDLSIKGIVDYVDKIDPEMLAPYINNKNGNTRNAVSLETWTGDYTFEEYALPDQNMFYSISVYKENASYYAEINIDGFQTMERLKAKVVGNETSIDLLFDSYLPDNMIDAYKDGDHLLSLERTGSKLFTKWVEIEPMLPDNNVTSGEYFEKAGTAGEETTDS